MTLIRSVTSIAAKDYNCSACEWFEYIQEGVLTFSQLRVLAKIEAEGYKVLKGTKYVRDTVSCDGIQDNKFRIDASDLCNELGLWDDADFC